MQQRNAGNIAEQPIEFHARWSGSAGQVVKMMSRNAGTG